MGAAAARHHPASGACRHPGTGVAVARRSARLARARPRRRGARPWRPRPPHRSRTRRDLPVARTSSGHATPAMSAPAIGARACSCAAHTGSPATSAEVCSRRFRRSCRSPRAADDPLHDVIALLSRELAASAPGHQTVLDRLLDVLLVLAMRACFQRSATCTPLVSGVGRSAAEPGFDRHACGRRAPVDGARTGRRQRAVTGSFCAKLSAGTGSGTHAVPDRLAHDAGSRSPAHRRVDARADRRAHRLRLALRLCRSVPPPPRPAPRSMAPTRAGPTRHQSASARRRRKLRKRPSCLPPYIGLYM